MSEALRGISSMATKHVLAELAETFSREKHARVAVTSMGGVDAIARIRAGEACDFVALASDAITKLEAERHVVAGTRTDVARVGIAVAVAKDAAAPDISSEASVRDALAAARSIGYSTGPSGTYLLRLFERWGIAQALKPSLVQAPPGVGVGELIARGEVALGFHQLSELVHDEGIRLVGMLPSSIQSMTVFSGGVCARSQQPDAALAWLAFLADPRNDACKRRHGMEPVARD